MRPFFRQQQWLFVAVLCLISALLTGCQRGSMKAADQSVVLSYLTVDLGDGVTMRLVLIPAGKFTMGSPDDEDFRDIDEGPRRRVKITKPFYMGVYEVTQAQWKAVMGTKPWKDSEYAQENPDNAANCITWEDAMEFCRQLGQKTNQTVRLPTEAEWEYACRAGSKTRFHYGDDLDYLSLGDYAWHSKNAWDMDDKYPHPVGCKAPNAWDLYDMYGNVWEWCSDWWQDGYKKLSTKDPAGPASGSCRVLRGGAFCAAGPDCRSANRYGNSPVHVWYGNGLRVVIAPEPGR